MEITLTPKQTSARKFRFVRSSTFNTPTSYKRPLIHSTEKHVNLEDENLPVEVLKSTALELWKKNETLKKEIEGFENEGYEGDKLKWYIDKFHEYNEIKDIAQMVMGRIAVIAQTTVRKIHEEYGLGDND